MSTAGAPQYPACGGAAARRRGAMKAQARAAKAAAHPRICSAPSRERVAVGCAEKNDRCRVNSDELRRKGGHVGSRESGQPIVERKGCELLAPKAVLEAAWPKRPFRPERGRMARERQRVRDP